MALELKKTNIVKMPGAKKVTLEPPDIFAGVGGGLVLPCLGGFFGVCDDGLFVSGGRVVVGAVITSKS